MLSKKKLLIIILAIVIIGIAVCVSIFLFQKKDVNVLNDVKEVIQKKDETVELENQFVKLFVNLNYTQNNEDVISNVYKYEKEIENQYEVKVHLPKFNLETCNNINTEILQIFGDKLVDIANKPNENIKYTVDYISYINKNVVSLIVRCVLKEGSNPQRVIIKTYNYDVNNEKLLTLNDILEIKELNKDSIQSKIKTKIKEKITSTNDVINQGFNVYERDFNSEEYLIENIENFFLDKEGNLYVVFPYGNSNFTEETDVIVFK